MTILRRILGWAFFLGVLGAVGFGVFHFVRYRPRCVIGGSFLTTHLSSDGSKLWTLMKKNYVRYGPAQAWDTHTGEVTQELLGDVKVTYDQSSGDGRHLAVKLDDGTLRLIDWHIGKDMLMDELRNLLPIHFSSKGRWLHLVADVDKPSFVVDVASGKVALRLESGSASFSNDDRLLFGLEFVWNLKSNKKVLDIRMETYSPMSPDGQLLLLLERSAPRPLEAKVGSKEPGFVLQARAVDLWDLTALKPRFHRDLARVGALHAAFSPNSRYLAMWLVEEQHQSDLEMLDTATGKLVWSYPMKGGQRGSVCGFSPDGSLWSFLHKVDEKNLTATMFDVSSGRVRWERPSVERKMYFAGETGIVLHQEDTSKPLLFLDARTGEQKAMAPRDFPTFNYHPALTPDGRHFLMRGMQKRNRQPYFWEPWLEKRWPDVFGDNLHGVLVMESATARELFRVVKLERQAFVLSEDASTLVAIERVEVPGDRVVIRVWDVRPTRAWLWAGGMAGVTGAVLIFLRWAWRMRPRRESVIPQRPFPSAPLA